MTPMTAHLVDVTAATVDVVAAREQLESARALYDEAFAGNGRDAESRWNDVEAAEEILIDAERAYAKVRAASPSRAVEAH